VFSQQVVELIVAEEQVVIVEELSLVFVLRVLLDELFISNNFCNGGDFQVLDLILISSLRVTTEDAESGLIFRAINGDGKLTNKLD